MENPDAKSAETVLEVRPAGMLVQRRDDLNEDGEDLHHKHNHETAAASASASSGGPMINIHVAHGPAQHQLYVLAHSTFGNFLLPSLLPQIKTQNHPFFSVIIGFMHAPVNCF